MQHDSSSPTLSSTYDLGRGDELELIKELRQFNAAMRIVVTTDVDSFASVVMALRAGADDYILRSRQDPP